VASGAGADRDARAALRGARRVCSARTIAQALRRMAGEIAARLADKNPVVLAVMHGGVFAAVELSKRLRFPHEFDYVHVTRYGHDTRGGAIEWRKRPAMSLAGRTVLIVDDVLDRGDTLRALHAELERVGVAERRTAVLVSKNVARWRKRPEVDFVGVEVEDEYLFGCGMDYRGHWRGLMALYALDPQHLSAAGDADSAAETV
jgi:hypoxanthine phosphoribosyltransferase